MRCETYRASTTLAIMKRAGKPDLIVSATAWNVVVARALARFVRQVPAASGEGYALEVGTVDGFQGREKEAIVISLVRSNGRRQVGTL